MLPGLQFLGVGKPELPTAKIKRRFQLRSFYSSQDSARIVHGISNIGFVIVKFGFTLFWTSVSYCSVFPNDLVRQMEVSYLTFFSFLLSSTALISRHFPCIELNTQKI